MSRKYPKPPYEPGQNELEVICTGDGTHDRIHLQTHHGAPRMSSERMRTYYGASPAWYRNSLPKMAGRLFTGPDGREYELMTCPLCDARLAVAITIETQVSGRPIGKAVVDISTRTAPFIW